MPAHFADFIQQQESPGVIVISQRVSVVRAIDELALVWEASRGEEWVNLIVELPLLSSGIGCVHKRLLCEL